MEFKLPFVKYRTNVKQLNTKTPFFTSGELLDKYLLKHEKVSISGLRQFNYIKFRRKYHAMLESLALLYRSHSVLTERFQDQGLSLLSRSYLNNLSSVWWFANNQSVSKFDYSKFLFSLNANSNIVSQKVSYEKFVSNSVLLKKVTSLVLLDEHFISKISNLARRSIWSFIPHSPKSVSGGTSYLALAIGQIPSVTVDYMLTLAQPDDILQNAFLFGSKKYLELYLINFITSKFSPTWLSSHYSNTIFGKYLLSFHINRSSVNLRNTVPVKLRFLERLLYLQDSLPKEHSHELEQLEYYDTAKAPYESFINIWIDLFDSRIRFLDLLYNLKAHKQLMFVWTNYLEYLEMHDSEQVILDHKDIPSYQQGLILFWGYTHFKSLTLSRIRVTNMLSRNYLLAYENLRFSQEVSYSYSINFVDEITEDSYIGYFDLASFLEDFYDEGFDFMEEEFPYVYHWDDEDDSTLGLIFPYAYLEIFSDQFEFSTYYYQTDEMARNYNTMQIYKPYNLAAQGFEWLVPNTETDMNWFNELFYSAAEGESELNFALFKDQYSKQTWKIKSVADRSLKIPRGTTLDLFMEDRSVDLSFFALSHATNLNALTTYSLDSIYDLYLTPQKDTIIAQRYDSWFPTFIATKFRRV